MKTMNVAKLARSSILFIVLSLVSFLSISLGSGAAAAASIRDGDGWNIIPSQNVSASGNYLASIAAISTRDAWAVGSYYGNNGPRTLIEHWNGKSWHIVASPNPSPNYDALNSVVAISATNVWAVGGYRGSGTSINNVLALIEHWDGSRWSVVSAANSGTGDSTLNSVAATSANDVWTVGFTDSNSSGQALIEHWNGTVWSIVLGATIPSLYHSLASVTALSANNAWAVGFYSSQIGKGSQYQTLVEHWDGSTWSIVNSPNAGSSDNYLNGVTVLSEHNAWAVGSYVDSSGTQQTLTEHWNGTAWSVVTSPSNGSIINSLNSVIAISAHDVLAAGYYIDGNGFTQSLIEHWNGTAWSVVTTPTVGSSSNLNVITTVPGTHEAWAVGGYFSTSFSQNQTLTELFC